MLQSVAAQCIIQQFKQNNNNLITLPNLLIPSYYASQLNLISTNAIIAIVNENPTEEQTAEGESKFPLISIATINTADTSSKEVTLQLDPALYNEIMVTPASNNSISVSLHVLPQYFLPICTRIIIYYCQQPSSSPVILPSTLLIKHNLLHKPLQVHQILKVPSQNEPQTVISCLFTCNPTPNNAANSLKSSNPALFALLQRYSIVNSATDIFYKRESDILALEQQQISTNKAEKWQINPLQTLFPSFSTPNTQKFLKLFQFSLLYDENEPLTAQFQLKFLRPRGILLFGLPGTGKTALLRHFLHFYGMDSFEINYFDTENAAKLREKLSFAAKIQPIVVIFDEISSLLPKTEEDNANYYEILHEIAQFKRDLAKNSQILLIFTASCEKLGQMSGEFLQMIDFSIEFSVPSAENRLEIIKNILKERYKGEINTENLDFSQVNGELSGFMGCDVEKMIDFASFHAKVSGNWPNLTQNDINYALSRVKPQNIGQFTVISSEKSGKIGFSSVFGLEKAKETLFQSCLWPFQHKQLFSAYQIRPTKGVLLYGPPVSSTKLGNSYDFPPGFLQLY
jgi:ATP-dependent 26S proteasome regulatory subunit